MRLRAWWLAREAQWYYVRGAFRKGAAVYQQALDAAPDDRGARRWRALALAELGRYGEARSELERAGGGRTFLARILYDQGEIEQAGALLSACQQNQQASGLLALCRLRAGEVEQAESILARGLPHAPWLLGRLLAAIEERAGVPPREPPAEIPAAPARFGGLRRGLVYLRDEKWGKALAALRVAAPADPRVGYGLGVSLYYLRHFEESRKRLLEALDRLEEPFRSDARATVGKNTLELGDPGGAILLLRRAIAAGAVMPENQYALGLALLRCGRTALARRAFGRCATPAFVRQRLEETKLLPACGSGV